MKYHRQSKAERKRNQSAASAKAKSAKSGMAESWRKSAMKKRKHNGNGVSAMASGKWRRKRYTFETFEKWQ
jgi:hypothetical protein